MTLTADVMKMKLWAITCAISIYCVQHVLGMKNEPFSRNCVENVTNSFIQHIVGGNKITLSDIRNILSPHLKETKCLESKDLSECLHNGCLDIEDIFGVYNLTGKEQLSEDEFLQLAPAFLAMKTSDGCHVKSLEDKEKKSLHVNPSSSQTWGFAFLFVTIINACSLTGAFVLPFMKRSFYNQMLIFMVGLAVGSLAASGLLVLIPEALGLMYIKEHNMEDVYVWKCLVVAAGVYLFFLIERLLKIFFGQREKVQRKRGDSFNIDEDNEDSHIHRPSIKSKTPIPQFQKLKNPNTLHPSASSSSSKPLVNSASGASVEDGFSDLSDLNCEQQQSEENGIQIKIHLNGKAIEHHQPKKEIATVAWMIIFGDGLHNFIDGLAIGAAFTESILAGISLSIAVICEELPHELGDFAILLNAGMTAKKALMFNFISACMCYLGLIVGILLGENTSIHDWIFAIAGGMFLYISLVDMMPEMNSAAENEENIKSIGSLKIFILQNIGMLAGFSVILIMVLYGEYISIEG